MAINQKCIELIKNEIKEHAGKLPLTLDYFSIADHFERDDVIDSFRHLISKGEITGICDDEYMAVEMTVTSIKF